MFDPIRQVFDADKPTCANRDAIGCNWRAMDGSDYCRSCNMTKIIPDTFHSDNVDLWRDAERAKRWVLANLARWGWFTGPDLSLAPDFHLLAEETRAGPSNVIMGHAEGLITINVAEADPTERIKRREDLGERLRTMIAHFRHEIAHFLFLRLARSPQFHSSFRELFGNETIDYPQALSTYYENGAPEDYAERYVTRYASSHPHEDWAETAAHLMHLTDILDSAQSTGLIPENSGKHGPTAYDDPDGESVVDRALSLGLGLNHINRSMGLDDVYPFVTRPLVRRKLIFAHGWISKGPPPG